MKREGVAVIDFGGQYAHLISRRIRDLGVYAEIVPYWRWQEVLDDPLVKAVVLSGGPASVYDENAPQLPVEFFQQRYQASARHLLRCPAHGTFARWQGRPCPWW